MKKSFKEKKTCVSRRDFIKTTAAAGAGISAGMLSRAALSLEGRSRRPNIILIMCDDMGFSDLGCYGSEIDTPNINKLAENGLRFSQFYNAARCCPTRASLLTGLYPHQAGIGHMAETGMSTRNPSYQGYLKKECVTIAEALKQAGYHTLMAGKWHVGAEKGHWPVDRGFDEYFGIPGGACNYFRPWESTKLARNDELVEGGEGFYTTDAFTDYAIDFIKEYSRKDDNPFFLYLAYNAPHWPLHAKQEDINKYINKYLKGWDVLRQERYERQVEMGIIDETWPLSKRDRATPPWKMLSRSKKEKMAHKMSVYAAMVDCVDQNVGRLLQAVDQTKEMDNTLIMFLSDNGACHEWGPWGVNYVPMLATNVRSSAPIGSPDSFATYGRGWSNVGNTPFRLHKHWTHEGGISTPLIANWPLVIKQKGEITDQTGHIIDLMATCLDAAGVSYPSTYKGNTIIPLEGKSLIPIFQGRVRQGHECIYWEHEGNRAVRMGNWKIVSDHPGTWELYDMEHDRTELDNLAYKNHEVVKKISRNYRSWAERCGVKWWPYAMVSL